MSPASRLLVTAGWMLGGDPVEGHLERDAALLIAGGIIVETGPAAQLLERHADVPREGGSHLLALPGLVNAHHHGRGVTWLQQGHPDEPLETWLLGFRLAHVPDPEADARYAAERLLRSGVTTVILSHYLPAGPDLADAARAALHGLLDTGVRVVFAVGFMDRGTWNDPQFRACVPAHLESRLTERVGPAGQASWPAAAFDLFDALRREASGDSSSRLVPALGPVAPQWCSDDLLREVARCSQRTGAPLHMHAVETVHQRRLALARTGQPQLARLADLGVLSERASLAHAVWLEAEDVAAVRRAGATVVHNPSSNMRLGSGRLALANLLDGSVYVALGTDCAGIRDDDDLVQELGLAAIAQRGPETRWLNAAQAVALATTGGARAAGLHGVTGALRPGYRADVVLIDLAALAAPAPVDWASPLDLLVGRATAQHVRTVLVDGEVVVRDGQTTRTDGAQTAARLAEALRHVQPNPADAELIAAIKPVALTYAVRVQAAAEHRQVLA
jgi:5-methylthioadenosine/S-adenosylhomocysteine deaminase